MLGQPRRGDELPGFQRSTHRDDGPERAGEDCGEAIKKAADTEASATVNAAGLTGGIERRATAAALATVTLRASVTVGVTSGTAGVTGVVTMVVSALRRMRPASSQAFSRRPVRILFQPHWRPSFAAPAVTRPSG
jgi:hypothetical protein